MTILSYKTIFGPTFNAILEICWSRFFAMSQKLRFWPKIAIFSHVRPNLGKIRIFGLCYLFTLIVPQLHAKFRKNPWSGFRDQLRYERTNERTDKGDIIEPVAFAGSKRN